MSVNIIFLVFFYVFSIIKVLQHSFKPELAMTLLIAWLFIFLYLMNNKHGSAAVLDNCVFLGEEDKNSLYEDGDVVIGGLFPLHYSPVFSHSTYKEKPKTNMYK